MFKFGDVVRVVEQAGAAPVLGLVNAVDGELVSVAKFVNGTWSELKNIVGHPTLEAAQAEDAGQHAVHTVAPLVDVVPAAPAVEPEPAAVVPAPAAPVDPSLVSVATD